MEDWVLAGADKESVEAAVDGGFKRSREQSIEGWVEAIEGRVAVVAAAGAGTAGVRVGSQIGRGTLPTAMSSIILWSLQFE